MKILELTGPNELPIAIPAEKVTGICGVHKNIKGLEGAACFVGTGADGEHSENGWYVKEDYNTVKHLLMAL